jgi:UDP-GlcNAc:undecaprenyl-phosphate GlcNAc-1-phosphate transferase
VNQAPSLSSHLIVMAIAFGVTLVTVPLFRIIAISRGHVVAPDERRAHEQPTPTLGGAAMFLGFAVAMLAAWTSGRFDVTFAGSSEAVGVVGCAFLAYLVGLIDDVREISAPAKLAGLVLAGTSLVITGVSIIQFRIPFSSVFILPLDMSYLITVLWLLGMCNAVNFIDGLDGLAAGIMGIAALAFFLYVLKLGDEGLLAESNIGSLIAVIVVGICAGFLPWNFNPAKIFMGDGGALLLGALMAASTVAVGGRVEDPFSGQTFFFYAPMVIPLLILGVPIIDTVFAIIRRTVRRQGLATADKGHLHHRLMNLGHGHRRSVAILWAWTGLLSAFVLWPVYNDRQGDTIVPFGVAAFGLLLLSAFSPGVPAIVEAFKELERFPGDRGDDEPSAGVDEADVVDAEGSNVHQLDEVRRAR